MAISRRARQVIAGTMLTIVVSAFALHAILMMQRHGLDATYRNYKGALMHYSGVLVIIAIGVICALGSYLYAWWYRRRERRAHAAIVTHTSATHEK